MQASTSLTDRPALRLVPPLADEPPAVAVILEDGSVHELARNGEVAPAREQGWASGSVAGDGWILWWERRSF
jgi:hypothetical protein